MFARLPNLTAKDARRAFESAGFRTVGQSGSHVKLQNGEGITFVIPMHHGDLKRPLLKALIKQAKLTEATFRKLL